MAYSHGVSSIKNITPIINLAKKNIFIFSDSDKAAIDARESYIKENGYQSDNWYTIEDLGGGPNQTVEDYLKKPFLEKGIYEVLGSRDIDIRCGKPFMACIDGFTREQKSKLKYYYASNVKASDIEQAFFDMLEQLAQKINEFSDNSE